MRVVTIIYFLIVYKFTYPFFIRYFGFPYINSFYVNSLFFGLFIYARLLYPVLNPARVWPATRVSKYGIMFFALSVLVILTGFWNNTNWFIITKSIIDYYFPYLFLFLSITRIELTKKEQGRLIKLCYILIFLQIPVVLMQYFGGGYSSADSISGTISDNDEVGGTGINAVLSGFLFSVCISRIVITGLTPGYLVLSLLTFVPPIAGGVRFGFILMVVVSVALIFSLIWVGDSQGGKKLARLIVPIFIFAVFAYCIFNYFLPKSKFSEYLDFDLLTDREAIMEYDSAAGSQRLSGYEILYNFVFKDWNDVLFGLGPGTIIGSAGSDLKPSEKIVTYFPAGASDGVFFMLAIGTIGLALVIMILFYGVLWVKKYMEIETCPFMRLNGYAFISITVACLVSLGYTVVWSSQIGLTYWVVAGVLMNRYTFLPKAIDKTNCSTRL